MKEPFKNDKHHLAIYQQFAANWGIKDLESLVKNYDIYELNAFLPEVPTDNEKKILQSLIGTSSPSGYMDYQRSTNTFELIMQWRENTNNLGTEPYFLKRE